MHRILLVVAFVTIAAPAFAQMNDDAPPPASPPPNPDLAFAVHKEKTIAFTHAEIIDGTGAEPLHDMTLVESAGRITAITPSANAHIPRRAAVIDAHGKTLLPGFVMMHEHLFYPTGQANYGSMHYSFPRLYLAGGTTTARTAGSMSPYGDISTRFAIEKGEAIGPDLDTTGPYINGTGFFVPMMHALTGPDDATKTVNYWADEGATSFKAYVNITHDELKAAIDAAHAHGAKITGHLCSITYREAAELGIDNLEHGFAVATDFIKDKKPNECPPRSQLSLADVDINSPEVKSLIDTLVRHHVALTSTLTVFETFTPGRPEAPEAARALLIPQLRKSYEDAWTDTATNPVYKPYAVIFPKLMQMERMFVAAGGTLMAGTDPTGYGGVVPGFSGKREIELLVEAGFTFPEALKIATLNGAKFLGRDKDVGSLAVGKRANLVLVDGDPMKDAAAIEHMPLVFRNGTGYDTAAIFAAMQGVVGLY